MPRINEVRFTVKKSDTGIEERYMVDEGTTYREILEDELCVNPDKFTLYVNGNEADLSDAVESNDVLNLQPKKYSSGNIR